MTAAAAQALRLVRRPWVLVTLALCVVALVLGVMFQPRDGLPRLHPDSAAPDGTLALVLTLRELGAEVEVGDEPPAGGDDTAILLRDALDDADREALLEWVQAGGRLLVADPASDVTRAIPTEIFQGFGTLPLARNCDLQALATVPELDDPGGVLFAPAGGTACYTLEDPADGAWMLVQPLGAGTVVRVGGAEPFTNSQLGEGSHAALAAAILWPEEDTRVRVVYPEDAGTPVPPSGQGTSVTDLAPPTVRTALWQLVAAFAIFALWRGRRLGRPVTEPQPVELPASELVVSVGNLLQRAGRRADAATILADDLRRRLAERLGLPASSTPEQVADTVAARTGIERDRVLSALAPIPPADERELLGRSQTIAEIQREVARVR